MSYVTIYLSCYMLVYIEYHHYLHGLCSYMSSTTAAESTWLQVDRFVTELTCRACHKDEVPHLREHIEHSR